MKKNSFFSKLTVAVVDDEKQWIKKFLIMSEKIRDFDCIYSSTSIDGLFKDQDIIRKVDIVFLDINLNGIISTSYIPKIRQLYPHIEIVMFTVFDDQSHLMKSLCLGANGYIVKSSTDLVFKNQIDAYRAGGAFLSARMALKLVEYFNPDEKTEKTESDLNTKELQILKLISEGWSYKKIAENIDISINLLRYYIKKIYKKIQVNSKYEAKKYYDSQIKMF